MWFAFCVEFIDLNKKLSGHRCEENNRGFQYLVRWTDL